MKGVFLATISVLVMTMVVASGAALANQSGGFCRGIDPSAEVCRPAKAG